MGRLTSTSCPDNRDNRASTGIQGCGPFGSKFRLLSKFSVLGSETGDPSRSSAFGPSKTQGFCLLFQTEAQKHKVFDHFCRPRLRFLMTFGEKATEGIRLRMEHLLWKCLVLIPLLSPPKCGFLSKTGRQLICKNSRSTAIGRLYLYCGHKVLSIQLQ